MAKKEKFSISQYALPDRLKYMRERRNYTQSTLAKKANVSQSTIAQIESGKKDPSIATVKKIASALGIHLAVLFASEDVHVFDMKRLKKDYAHVDKLNETLYFALGRVVQYAKEIGFLS